MDSNLSKIVFGNLGQIANGPYMYKGEKVDVFDPADEFSYVKDSGGNEFIVSNDELEPIPSNGISVSSIHE